MDSLELQQIIDFVEGRLPAQEFEPILYANSRFEEVMGYDTYMSAITRSYKSPGEVANVQRGLVEFLTSKGIKVKPTSMYQNLFGMILDAQPQWLSVDQRYVQEKMLPSANELAGSELKKWLRAEFKRRFRYVSKPPKWIQNPNWPINENGPMLFMGQIRILNYWHDEGAIYVFYDPKTGAYENISQVY